MSCYWVGRRAAVKVDLGFHATWKFRPAAPPNNQFSNLTEQHTFLPFTSYLLDLWHTFASDVADYAMPSLTIRRIYIPSLSRAKCHRMGQR